MNNNKGKVEDIMMKWKGRVRLENKE